MKLKSNQIALVIQPALLFFLLWIIIPDGIKVNEIVSSLFNFIQSKDFIQDLIASLVLTFKSMFYSIVVALLISYLYKSPYISNYFKLTIEFITKCRYLTLTGLIFIFTQLSKDLSDLKIILLMFGIIPFFVTSMINNINSINPQYYDLCKTLKFNKWETLWEVVIVGKIDQAIEVIRQNFAMAWLMITMVEGLDMSAGGVGTVLIKSNRVMHLSEIFAVQFIILILGIGFDYFLSYLRTWLFPYVKLEQSK